MLVFLALTLLQEPTPPAPQAETAPAAAGPRTPLLLLRGATVHTLLPGDAPRVLDLWLEDGHIRALGPLEASAGDRTVLELAGKHVVPGLIDAHVNFDPEHDPLYLAAGVTLVRDLGGDRLMLERERLGEWRERVPGPTLLTAGAALDGDPPAAASAVVLRTVDSAAGYLPILFEERVDFLSILPGLPEDVWRKTLALAKERGLTVFGPRPGRLTLAEALAAGQDGFHALDSLLPPGAAWETLTSAALDDSIAALARAGKPLVPLLHASAARLEDQSGPEWRALFGLLAPTYESWWRSELAARQPALEPAPHAQGVAVVEKQARALRALFDAGAQLLPGSGAPQPWLMPGTALHQELAAWVRAGIPSEEVLALATREAAAALGLAGQRGTIEVGAWADLLVLDQDPRADLARLLDPAFVVVRGRAFARAELEAGLRALGQRQAARRAELERPLEVAPPPQAEGGVVLLEGTAESDSFGLRLASERYRVVRLDAQTLLYTTRVVYPPAGSGAARELTLEQFVRRGRLEQVHASLKEGASLLEHDGLWVANTWRMQTRLDGRIVSAPAPLREQPVCVDAGNVSSLLILAQAAPAESLAIVQLHPGFDAEPVNWRLELGEDGNHRVRTQVGYKAFRLDALGALEWALSKVGTGTVETRALSSSGFGGAGLPVPAAARAGTGPKAPAQAPVPPSAPDSTPPKAGG